MERKNTGDVGIENKMEILTRLRMQIEEIKRKAGLGKVSSKIKEARLRWRGHMLRR